MRHLFRLVVLIAFLASAGLIYAQEGEGETSPPGESPAPHGAPIILPPVDPVDDMFLARQAMDIESDTLMCKSVSEQRLLVYAPPGKEFTEQLWELRHRNRCWNIHRIESALPVETLVSGGTRYCVFRVTTTDAGDGPAGGEPFTGYLLRPVHSQRLDGECNFTYL